MGRKNYLFSKNDRGAEDNAVFYPAAFKVTIRTKPTNRVQKISGVIPEIFCH